MYYVCNVYIIFFWRGQIRQSSSLLSTKYSIERFIDDSQKVMEKNISGLYLWCKGPFNISRKKLVIFRWWCAVKNIYVLLLIFRVFAQLLKEYISYNIKLYEKPKLGFISCQFIFFPYMPWSFWSFYLIINSELWRGVLILLITYRNIQERTIHNITIES